MSQGHYSPTIRITSDNALQCVRCQHVLASNGESWKQRANRLDQPLSALGTVYDTGSNDVVIRRFFCPSCGTALDSETAVIGESVTDDVVQALDTR